VNPPILIFMGAPGSGKTTVGKFLAERLGWTFQEGDELHSAANVAKMERGELLSDEDRAPWLAAIAAWIDRQAAAGRPGIVSCSALKRAYRTVLTKGRPYARIVYLEASPALLRDRVAHRAGHFMPPSLLQPQLDIFEPPAPEEHPIVVNADQPVEAQADAVIRVLEIDPQMPAYHS
jgi:gluconokinase